MTENYEDKIKLFEGKYKAIESRFNSFSNKVDDRILSYEYRIKGVEESKIDRENLIKCIQNNPRQKEEDSVIKFLTENVNELQNSNMILKIE